MSNELAAFLALLALALLSMPVYAAWGPGRDADAQRRGSRFLAGYGDFLVHWLLWCVTPLEKASVRLGLTPDVFNFVGLLLGALSGVLIALGRLELGGWAIALGGICDILDGRIARATHASSLYGTFIDSTLDRFVETFAFLGLAVYLGHHRLGPLVVCAALAGSLLVSYTRARGESLGILCKEGLMQRSERLVLTLAACLVDPSLSRWMGRRPGDVLLLALCAIAVGTMGTATHRTLWISRRLRERDRRAAEPARHGEECPPAA